MEKLEKDAGMTWTKYQRQGAIEARPWTHEDQANAADPTWRMLNTPISVSAADGPTSREWPCVGFVARNPDNHADQWYIAPDYFAKHYCAALSPNGKAGEGA